MHVLQNAVTPMECEEESQKHCCDFGLPVYVMLHFLITDFFYFYLRKLFKCITFFSFYCVMGVVWPYIKC